MDSTTAGPSTSASESTPLPKPSLRFESGSSSPSMERRDTATPSVSGRAEEGRRGEDRIEGCADVVEAFRLAWQKQRRHLFTSWVHVPLGVAFLLVVTWGFRLVIDLAPFRFPAPVIVMLLLFALLLLLDSLSSLYPGQARQPDVEKVAQDGKQLASRRRFVDPVMTILAPPCEFCLRNMSVMFTPSFVLIPAREVIPGKEIGLIAAWFTISQVLAFVFPVLFNWAVEWAIGVPKKLNKRMKRTMSSTPSQFDTSRRASMATIAGVDWEKGMSFSGGQKLGPVATGLSGLTANVIAPISHLPMDIDADAWRQIESTVLEQARQQGDPAVTGLVDENHPSFRYRNYSPKSDVSSFQHIHHQHRPRASGRSGSRSRNRSASRTMDRDGEGKEDQLEQLGSSVDYRFPSPNPDTADAEHSSLTVPPPTLQTSVLGRVASFRKPIPDNEPSQHEIDIIEEGDEDQSATRVNSRNPSVPNIDWDARRPSRISFAERAKDEPLALSKVSTGRSGVTDKRRDSKPEVIVSDKAADEDEDQTPSVSSCDLNGCDAIERLSSWIGDLITPVVYLLVFIAGIPLYFISDFALPLFLGINILTFIAAITIVPAKIRRFLHPILSCSISTVLIIWAFAAMKGISLKDCLNQFYSVDTRYSDLWTPSGYSGPIPGAGDVLFSTLDAGIVALAVPMYRYRKELKENFVRMMVVLTPCAALSLFFWNWIAALMGMDQVRSLAFTARFMSTPLAIELATNIGADESITVILVVITGIIAAILKDHFFRLMRVDREDYLVVGITMGSTAGAIGASSLISTPRVMAVASLSFVIFGSILLIATAIPPIVDIVRALA